MSSKEGSYCSCAVSAEFSEYWCEMRGFWSVIGVKFMLTVHLWKLMLGTAVLLCGEAECRGIPSRN